MRVGTQVMRVQEVRMVSADDIKVVPLDLKEGADRCLRVCGPNAARTCTLDENLVVVGSVSHLTPLHRA